MSEKKKSFWKRLTEALAIPPIYAPIKQPSDASLAEGWMIAYEQEKERREAAEKRLDMLDDLANSIIAWDRSPQYGWDIKSILTMRKEELDGE